MAQVLCTRLAPTIVINGGIIHINGRKQMGNCFLFHLLFFDGVISTYICSCNWFHWAHLLVDTTQQMVTWCHLDLPINFEISPRFTSPSFCPTSNEPPYKNIKSPSYFLVAEEISIHTWLFAVPLGFSPRGGVVPKITKIAWKTSCCEFPSLEKGKSSSKVMFNGECWFGPQKQVATWHHMTSQGFLGGQLRCRWVDLVGESKLIRDIPPLCPEILTNLYTHINPTRKSLWKNTMFCGMFRVPSWFGNHKTFNLSGIGESETIP